jgi:hypothetical protein
MELAEAIRRFMPLQLQIPNPRKPLEPQAIGAAKVFLIESKYGSAVVWLEAFWCREAHAPVARIAYAKPRQDGTVERWVDHDPRYGPRCLAYQRPFIIERLTRHSPLWRDHRAWQSWRAMQGQVCGRRRAWQRAADELGKLVVKRLC